MKMMKMNFTQKHLWYIVLFIIAFRLVSLGMYPLMDTTEARYGEMARLMLETGNWITPLFDYNIPFWGKPPLFTWVSALSASILGVSEFSLRLPHFLMGLIIMGLMAYMAHRFRASVAVCVAVLASCIGFIVASGAIMTDTALTLSFTLAMMGFYLCWLGEDRHARLWGYVGFVGLALGLLAKGPTVIVLMGIAVFPWLVLQHGFVGAFKALWQRFPLATGTLLMLAIAVPWYVVAEQATPGFLNYFIIGEHFNRFLVSGWQGDLYGHAHHQALGTIWLYWIIFALPWSFVLLYLLWKRLSTYNVAFPKTKGLCRFLMCWALSPLLLFTFAANILPAYVFPGIPPLGLLIALLAKENDMRWVVPMATATALLLPAALFALNFSVADVKSDKLIFDHIKKDYPVFYYGKRPFSGQFYSEGQAKELTSMDMLEGVDDFYLIGKAKGIESFMEKNAFTCDDLYDAPSKRSLFMCRQ